jgi:O-antigen/teichoic acid export membrane protein
VIQTNAVVGLKSVLGANRQAIRSVAALFSGNIASTAFAVLGGLLAARFLGPEETGLFRSFTIPLTYLSFLHLGTFDGLWRQIPYYTGKNMPQRVEALAASAGAYNVFISLVVSAGFGVCAAYSAWHHDLYGVVGWLTQILCCWGVFYIGYLGATYRTLHHFVVLARIQVAMAAVNFAGVFSLPWLRFFGLCGRSAASYVVGIWLYHRHRPLKVRYHFAKAPFKELVRVGLPFSFWGSIYSSVWTATESALMLSLGGVTGLGLFAAASVLREGVNVLPQAVNQVMMPRVVESIARTGTVHKANMKSVWVTVLLTVFMVPVVLLLSYLLDYLVPLAIPKYVEGIQLMKVCLWFSVVQAAALPINTLFATGRSWLTGRGVIVGIIVFPITAYLLTPSLGGILAVAFGSLAGRFARTLEAYLEITLLTRRRDGQILLEVPDSSDSTPLS